MTRARRWGRVTGWVVAGAMVLPWGVSGQERVLPPPELVLVGGAVSYDDVEESGSATLIGLRIDFPLSDLFTLEPGLERATWTNDDGDDETRWVVDFALHLEYGFGRIVPYVGGNLGAAFDFAEERDFDEEFMEALFGGHGGVRLGLTDRLDARGEVRGRWYDRFDSTWLVYTGGLGWRF